MKINIVITVNKLDLWFCRICVASIRYYYPGVNIYLLKDEMNGAFSTTEIETIWNVGLIEYPVKKFGWAAAKIHFLCDERFKGERFLILDADIVFIGKLLDLHWVHEFKQDVIISEERFAVPESEWFTKTYFDYKRIQEMDSAYVFPGYSFNTGQLFCKGGFLKREWMEPYFDFNSHPSWKQTDLFPLVDQSVFNYLFPKHSDNGELKMGQQHFMLWSEAAGVKKIQLENVMAGTDYPYLIHWAGALRIPDLGRMTRGDILQFFENYYYSKIQFSNVKKLSRRLSYKYNNIRKKVRKKILK